MTILEVNQDISIEVNDYEIMTAYLLSPVRQAVGRLKDMMPNYSEYYMYDNPMHKSRVVGIKGTVLEKWY